MTAQSPQAARDRWAGLATAVLRKSGTADGTDAVSALSTKTADEIGILPLYTAADADGASMAQPWRAGAGDWDVRVRCAGGDDDAPRDELAAGADSLWLVLGDGLPAGAVPDLLDGIDLSRTPVVLDAGGDTPAAAFALLGAAERLGAGAGALRGSLGADPIGARARTGAPAELSVLLALAEQSKASPALTVATVDATIYHDAGATDAQEIAIATAVGVAYLRALCDGGVPVDAALAALEFRFAVGADQFAGIAKLRAARRVWDRVAELCGAPPDRRTQRQHAVTSAAMMTRRDPWVNMLRATVACFAAAAGGADAITVLPFDHAVGVPDAFARRIARNTSAVLHDESSLGRVADAAGGSWYVESLTAQLAARAWEIFTGVERQGGALSALDSGYLDGLMRGARERRADDIAHRRVPITGVSEFALLDEQPLSRPPAAMAPDGPLPRVRDAAPFEALRERADAWTRAHGNRPRVFLAALGGYAEHSAAVGFAANLFAAGGIEAVTGTGASDTLVEQWRAAASPVACLCSSDAVYADSAAAEAAALKAAGVRLLWLVGEPGTRLGPDLSAGVDGYVYRGCDALDVLGRTIGAMV